MIGMGPFIPMYQILSKMITNNYQALLESLTTGILITIQPSQQTINETRRDEKNLQRYTADLVNTGEGGKQGLLLLEAFSCGRSAA